MDTEISGHIAYELSTAFTNLHSWKKSKEDQNFTKHESYINFQSSPDPPQPRKSAKTAPSSWAGQKQMVGQIWHKGCGLPTPDLECNQESKDLVERICSFKSQNYALHWRMGGK